VERAKRKKTMDKILCSSYLLKAMGFVFNLCSLTYTHHKAEQSWLHEVI